MANHITNTSIELENSSNDDISQLKNQIAQLNKENDDCKQTIHCLQSKVQVDLGVRNELQETVDNLEKSMQQLKNKMQKKINDIEEKNGFARMELMSKLNEMEHELEEKSLENQELRQQLVETNKLLSLANVEKQAKDLSIRDETIPLYSQHEELMEKLSQEVDVRKSLEHTVDAMSKEELELKRILEMNKEQLAEKSEMLKIAQDELQECRIELETIRNVPASDICKGNSLFAEVEDRRKKLLDRMANMKTQYYDLKRSLISKDNEIKALKIELAALLNKQKDDADNCIQENGDLLDKYKDRILELENKLSELQKKYRKLEMQKQPTDNTFSYFQSLLDVKRKEAEELEAKIENLSVQSLTQEEIKLKTNRQMRYWRNKAMLYEARVETIKFQLQNNSSFDNEKLSKLFQRDCPIKTSADEASFTDSIEKLPPVIDETVISLDELINIPKLPRHKIYHENEERSNAHPMVPPNDDTLPNSFDSNDKSSDIKNWQDHELIKSTHSAWTGCHVKNENEAGISMSSLKNTNNRDKEKKILRFSEETVDPEPRKLRRQNTPKYPILYVTNKSGDE